MEKPINPRINRVQLKKLLVELEKAWRVIDQCCQAVRDELDKQAYYEETLQAYKETKAHETMVRTVVKMRNAGSTFAEISKKVGKDRREVSGIYRKARLADAQAHSK